MTRSRRASRLRAHSVDIDGGKLREVRLGDQVGVHRLMGDPHPFSASPSPVVRPG